MATLQNLREDYLYEKLPEGIITLDEQNILRALVGGIQDRVEDIRSYAKKYEVLFSAEGMTNTSVLVTFETGYGKVVTRSLDIQDDTPEEEGIYLTTWAADQLGIESSQITSCVFGEDLLRYVDTNTLQYLAATIGAVLYQTAAQSGDEALNQQKILNSYFPRLKIKGTAMSFDILGKLIGFDDVRMTPLWGRLSPRVPNDIGDPANDADLKETPEYMPQQQIGVAYDPHVFRDGPYYTWTGTVTADPSSTAFYTQTVNGFQPWVKVLVTGSVVHPAIGSSITLDGGSPHTKASADAGQGLMFQALGEGVDFNGLQVTFENWNSGTDRLVSITDRLSTIKYRTSYFDLALTLTDQHALEQFGTTTTKPNADLIANPAIADDGRVAVSPFRPWRAGRRNSGAEYHDFTWVSSGTSTQVSARQQATTAFRESTQFKTDELQAAGQEAVQIMDEVRAATRFPRRSSVGFLNKDDVTYAGFIEHSFMFEMSGTSESEGIAASHPAPGYALDARIRNATALRIRWQTEVGYRYYIKFSNNVLGPYVRISEYYTGDGQIAEFFLLTGSGSGFDIIVKEYWNGTTWVAVAPPSPTYAIVSVSFPMKSEIDPLSNGTLVRFSDGVFFSGTYDFDQHWYRFQAVANHHSLAASGLTVDAYWSPTTTEVVRSDPNSTPLTQVFAAFGDNSDPSIDHTSYQVGTLVASWQPEFLVMLGDHNYRNDAAKYPNENSNFMPWINDGKVIAIPGNHDLDIDYGKAFYDFFKMPSRYFSRRIGNVEFFAIDDGILTNEQYLYPDWRGQLSEPARWLKEAMSASQAPWKIVMIHHNAYSSANSGHSDYDYMKWPFKDWGADLVLNGHVHGYEHNYVQHPVRGNNGIHVLTIGFGGHSLISYSVGAGSYGSIYRYPLTTQQKLGGATRFTVTPTTLKWDTYTVDGTLRETYTLTKSAPNVSYQSRPEDEPGVSGAYEIFDEVPWRRDLVGNGELVEIINRTPPVVDDVLVMSVSDKVAVKDQTGADYTVYGINSTVSPIRMAAEANPTDAHYTPGQIPIAYRGDYIDLLGVVVKRTDTIGFFTEAEAYGTNSFKLYHAGLVHGVFVADPVSFNGPHHRNGLVGWMPMNEHPDDEITVHEVALNLPVEVSITGVSQSDRVWSDERGWYLDLPSDGTVKATVERSLSDEFSLSFWIKPGGNFSDTRVVSYDPLFIDSALYGTALKFNARTDSGTEALVATGTIAIGEFNYVTVSKNARGYSCGIGKLAEALTMLGTNTSEAYAQFNEAENSAIILRAPSSVGSGSGSVISGQPLDIMFSLDYSGSMAAERAALIAALGTFDAALTAAGFSTRYGFVSFGEPVATPVMVQDLTSFAPFLAVLSAYAPGAGGTEYGSVSVSTASGASWTPGSVRLVILFTDEDDDSGPTGAFPNAGEVAQASTDLTNVGAMFFYSAQLAALGTFGPTDPYVYQNLANGHGGSAYDLASFLLDPAEMLDDIASLAVDAAAMASSIGFHDIRIWNRAKTEIELNKVRDYQPKETICTYWPTNIEVAGSRDHYGLRVLDNGFIKPDVMPPSIRINQLARVIRYDDKGRYSGENRFNEVGLGGGTPLPATWQLGQQFYEMNSNGTVVVSTSLGGTPFNPLWQLAGNDAYINLPYSGSTATGIPGVSTPYSAGGTWPPPMDFNNPAREFIWLKGDDNKVYEVNLLSTTTSAEMIGSLVVRERTDDELVLNGALRIVTADPYPQHSTWATTGTAWVTFDNGTFDQRNVLIETDGTFVASYSYASKGVAILTAGTGEVKVYHPQQFRFTDQPTGAVSVLVTNGTELSCNYGGYVYQRYTGGTLATPPLYMYLTARTVEDTATGATAHQRWTENVDTTLYGNLQSPRVAALNENGILEFENTGDITPGHYRLTIETGAIGRVDDDFDGFSVVMTIDTVQIEGRLLAGYTGADFSGEDVFEFDYDGNNNQNWLLTVQFLNALTDVNRGTGRNMWIKNFKLEKIATELYKVTIGSGPKPTLTQIQTGSYSGTNPGGWLAILNSYGTVVNMVHESNYFPANDTVMSNVPLSGMLTGNTIERREDHYTASSTISVLPDDAAVAMPSFGGIIVR